MPFYSGIRISSAALASIGDLLPTAGLALCLLSPPSKAGEAMSPFDVFNERCLRTGPDFDGTAKLAATHEWPQLSKRLLDALVPVPDTNASDGWVVSGDTEPLQVLIIFKANSDAGVVDGCTVGLSKVDTVAFEAALTDRMGFEPQDVERSIDHIYKKFFDDDPEQLVTVNLPSVASGADQVVASVMVVRPAIENSP